MLNSVLIEGIIKGKYRLPKDFSYDKYFCITIQNSKEDDNNFFTVILKKEDIYNKASILDKVMVVGSLKQLSSGIYIICDRLEHHRVEFVKD